MIFNHLFTNEEINAQIKEWESAYSNLLAIQNIGASHEGRPIHLLAITNQATGADTQKPAVWMDANIHATELTAATAALYIAAQLLDGYGKDARITRLLDTCVYYIVPRVNPDGAALALAPNPRYIRSGTRPYPWLERDDGLHQQDINGDGKILQMRLRDPHGDWKISSLDPRLLEKRAPEDHGGEYYRLLPEGLLEDYDGDLIKVARAPEGLDFNRNFPYLWRTEGEQRGAGPYPTSEPEIRALVDFVSTHPNINFAITFHTFSRVILRPYSTKSDDDMKTEDLWVFKKIGEIGTKLTDYRCVSTFHDFKYHPKEVTTGAFDDWAYDHLGIFAYTIELWDLPTAAGIKDRKFIEWWRNHPHEEDLQILKWIDENAPAGAFAEWQPFEHPQLGPVEIGGWEVMHTWTNPPDQHIEAEVSRHFPFMLALGDMLPHLALYKLEITPIGEETHLKLVIENTGFLPSYTSLQCQERKAARPVRVELELPQGVILVSGKRRIELGHLDGRSSDLDLTAIYAASPTSNRQRAEWVLRGPRGAVVTVKVLSERAGCLTKEVTL
ncbi:MAG: hypothetical protein JW726_06580 [Anaerolineales bacterium]|nr:hypothetical protein [Anaerolineales bacterium]